MPKKAALWFRFYVDTPDDIKVRSLPKGDRWIWAAVLSLAAESPEPGRLLIRGLVGVPVTFANIADKAGPGYTSKEAEAAVGRFVERGMMHRDGQVWVCTNFRVRNYLGETSTPRVQAHRDRLRNGPGNASETVDETPDGTVTDRYISHAGDRGPDRAPHGRGQSTESRDLATSDHPATDQPQPETSFPAARPRTTVSRSGSGLEPPYSAEFEAWWALCPKKRDKPDAFKAYQAKRRAGAHPDWLAAAMRHFAAYLEANPPESEQFIPSPARFLNSGRWLDFRDGQPAPVRLPQRRNGHAPRPQPQPDERSEPVLTLEAAIAERAAKGGPR